MPSPTQEIHFEAAIEQHLLNDAGYEKADSRNFDRLRGLDPTVLIPFIQQTQPKIWQMIADYHKGEAEEALLDDLGRALGSQGVLTVLRHGFKCFGKLVRVAYFAPPHGMNPETEQLYAANRLTVTRQLHYSTEHETSLDLVLSINGLPVVTAELKNPMSGQTVEHARRQYMNDRDPKDPGGVILQFKRGALVHFAVDPDLVFMTTRLSGRQTHFLPFNLGNGTGAGNPVTEGEAYKTFYLWKHVWQRDSLLDIIGRFMHLQAEEKQLPSGKRIRKESMIFPRYHQLDAVRKLVASARSDEGGPGVNYLVQHSAGSGKSNTIAWLAHRLSDLHDSNDQKIYDSVIVITDRRVLDQQLQNTIYQFEHKAGVVEKIDVDSTQLARALSDGVPIIVTTLQKFPFVTDKVSQLHGRRYAVIVDEAHSSQSGETAADLKGVLAAKEIDQQVQRQKEAEGLDDSEDELLRAVARRGKQPNLSFFAFTATPKYKTLEVFGRPDPDGNPEPFHLYSMRQAIEERFILDVLKNYTTYKAYYRLVKRIADDPQVEQRKAARALARFMSLHPANIAQKTEVMIEHFRAVTRHRIAGRAKAMVVTSSRLHAVRYKEAFDKYLTDHGYTDMRTLVAFSGTVQDPDVAEKTHTEVDMNAGIREKELPEKFATDEYHVLIVAEKYQTGFDQPLLQTMYVDKRLQGINSVQTLSRLNRICPGKDETFVLDFVNEAEEIRDAFKPYYEQPVIGEQADPRQMYDLQAKLNAFQVYTQEEVDVFCETFFKPGKDHTTSDHAQMNACVTPACERFEKLRDEIRHEVDEETWREEKQKAQEEFRSLFYAFRSLYSFMSQVVPYQDRDLEKLYTFGRYLLNKLPSRPSGPTYHFDDDVALKYYRLQKMSEEDIELTPGEPGEVKGPTAVGTSKGESPKIELSELIDILNDRFGTDFGPGDQLFWDSVTEDAAADDSLRQAAEANTVENFSYVFRKALEDLVIGRMEQNEGMVARYMDDPQFAHLVQQVLTRRVFDRINEESGAGKGRAAG